VNWPLAAALAAAGLVIGWCLRPFIVRLAAPTGDPPGMGGSEPGVSASPPGVSASPPGVSASPPGVSASPPGMSASPPGRYPSGPARTGPPPLLLEVATAILLGALAARVRPGLVLAAACWLAVAAIALAWIDVVTRRLPDLLTAPAYTGTVVLLLAAAAASGHWPMLLRALLGGLALAAAYLALAVISRGAAGLGDAKLAASLGTMLAWSGWPTLVAGVFAGFLLAAVYGLGLLVSGRATRGQRIPFGPFMIVGAFLAILAGT
jgi:leader peptidase (prepilin peptidase) / N-methyltransferase